MALYLQKNVIAKKYGVITGEAIWQNLWVDRSKTIEELQSILKSYEEDKVYFEEVNAS